AGRRRHCLPETTVPASSRFGHRSFGRHMLHGVLRNAIRPAFFVAILAAFIPIPAAVAQNWQNNGPDGGVVHCIATSPSDASVVYVGIANGGIYRTSDG